MKKEQIATLVGGFAIGVLVGFGLAQCSGGTPEPTAWAEPPSQPKPPAQTQPRISEPAMEEIGRLQQILRQDPENLQALTRMAHIYHDSQIWPQAVEFYEKVNELDPGNPNHMTDLGTCYGGMNRNREAIAMFRKANELDPNHWQSLFNTVIIAGLSMHDFETAEAALAKMEALPAAREKVPQLRQALEQARDEHRN